MKETVPTPLHAGYSPLRVVIVVVVAIVLHAVVLTAYFVLGTPKKHAAAVEKKLEGTTKTAPTSEALTEKKAEETKAPAEEKKPEPAKKEEVAKPLARPDQTDLGLDDLLKK